MTTGERGRATGTGWIVSLLFLGTVLLFGRVLGHGFVNYDDPDYVTSNAHVKAGLTLDGLRWAFQSGEASNWHPLTWMSHQLDATLYGERPRGHHLTSVLLHAFNAVLAFLVVRRLTGSQWTSAFFAALFSWHPLRVESVAWVSERKDVLSGSFALLTLWLYSRYAAQRTRGASWVQAWRPYALALGALALGLMSKPMLVTLPFVLLLVDAWPLGRLRLGRTSGPNPAEPALHVLGEKIPFLLLAMGSSAITYLVQKSGGSVAASLPLGLRLENAVVAVARYLGKFFWPADLAVLYPHPGHWPGATVAAAVVLLVGLAILGVVQWRRRPWILIGGCWFVGMLVPVIGIVQVGLQSMADRYTYLPILGVQFAVLWTLREWAGPGPAARRAAMAGGALVAAVALRTWDQTAVWQDSYTLFDHAIAVTSGNYVAHDNRGLHQFHAGRVEDAMADYRRALAINPGYLNAHNNLGYALAQTGHPAEAVPEYRAALRADPQHLEVRNNLANALSDLGQLAEAMDHYTFVLERRPDHVNALNGSAVALAMQNRLPEARARLERSLQIAPDNPSALNNLGNVLSMLGEREAAIRSYRRAAVINPSEAHALVLAGSLLNQQPVPSVEAVEVLQTAVARAPRHPDAHAQLGVALARLGRRDEAVKEFRLALQLQPNHPVATSGLAGLLAR